MNLVYFGGGRRLETLRKLHSSPTLKINRICVASIESNIKIYERFAQENNILFEIYRKDDLKDNFLRNGEDILLSVGFRYIIPPTIFLQFKYAVNIHPSLLPKYRGAYSGYAIIENGELETGITAHFIDE